MMEYVAIFFLGAFTGYGICKLIQHLERKPKINDFLISHCHFKGPAPKPYSDWRHYWEVATDMQIISGIHVSALGDEENDYIRYGR